MFEQKLQGPALKLYYDLINTCKKEMSEDQTCSTDFTLEIIPLEMQMLSFIFSIEPTAIKDSLQSYLKILIWSTLKQLLYNADQNDIEMFRRHFLNDEEVKFTEH